MGDCSRACSQAPDAILTRCIRHRVALLELYRWSGDSEFLDAALHGIRYERSQFSASEHNWPDYRIHESSSEDTSVCRTAWCHGAPGIALARLVANKLFPDDDDVRTELHVSLATTADDLSNFGVPGQRDWCLCHGRAGNADVLLLASSLLPDSGYREVAEQLGDWGIENFQNRHLVWPCDPGESGDSPNLMTGLAGIGYFYLRLYDANIPSLLLVPARTETSPHGRD